MIITPIYTVILFSCDPDIRTSKFCVSVSGFKVLDPLASPIFSPFYSTPTLHIIGRTDIVVVEERSQANSLDVSANMRVEEHDGGLYSCLIPRLLSLIFSYMNTLPYQLEGHFVPSKSNWRNFFRDYLQDPLGDVPSPCFSSSSATNSGATTPNNSNASVSSPGVTVSLWS